MNVLVTGATGLIGSHAARSLLAAGFHLTVVCRKAPMIDTAGAGVLLADLAEPSAEDKIVTAKPDAVVHCAAAIPVDFYGDEAKEAARINRAMDGALLRVCRRLNARLVYCSSASVYGATGSPWHEESPLAPLGAYAAAKAESEREIEASGVSHASLRISSPYAAGQRARNVLSIFIDRAMQGLDLLYYGTGARQQDFTAAADVAEAITQAVRQPAVSGIFNVATGHSVSMKQLAELVVRCVPGSASQVRPAGRDDAQENYRAVFNVAKVRAQLGWSAAIPLAKGITDWVAALRRNAAAVS